MPMLPPKRFMAVFVMFSNFYEQTLKKGALNLPFLIHTNLAVTF